MGDGIADYRDPDDLEIWGQPKAIDGLKLQQQWLEGLIKPLISKKKTGQVIRFKGKKAYLSDGLPPGRIHAVLALMESYSLFDAIAGGDVDQAIKRVVCLTTSVDNFNLFEKYGVCGFEAVMELKRVQGNRHTGGTNSGKFSKPKDKRNFEFAYAKHASKHNWAKATAQELVENYGYSKVSGRTVQRTVKKLNLRN